MGSHGHCGPLANPSHGPPPSQLHFNPRGGRGTGWGRAGQVGKDELLISTRNCLCLLICPQGGYQPHQHPAWGCPNPHGCSDKSFWSL